MDYSKLVVFLVGLIVTTILLYILTLPDKAKPKKVSKIRQTSNMARLKGKARGLKVINGGKKK